MQEYCLVGDDCVNTDTTTNAPETTVPGLSCPALSDGGGSWTCFPEVLPGDKAPDGAHCIWSCGETTSVHPCASGVWDAPPPTGCYCPALPTDEGELLCVPKLETSGEAIDGTFCIFSCGGHPVMELNCGEGSWDVDVVEVTCS